MGDNVFAARPLPTQDRTDANDPTPGAQGPRTLPIDTGAFVAIALTIAALLVWGATQTWLLVAERGGLQRAAASQQQQIDAANKVRGQLDAIASGMQRLADGGNGSARLVVEELRRRGVTITVGAASGSGTAR
jgi:hypothetical protein